MNPSCRMPFGLGQSPLRNLEMRIIRSRVMNGECQRSHLRGIRSFAQCPKVPLKISPRRPPESEWRNSVDNGGNKEIAL